MPYNTNSPYINPTQTRGLNPTFGESDQFNIPSFMNPFPFEQQRGEQGEFLQGFRGAIEGQETIPQMGDRLGQKYFIPELREGFQTSREAYQDVVNQIRNVPDMVKGNTRESMVTESQRQAKVGSEVQKLTPIAESLGMSVQQIGTMLTDAEKNLNTEMAYEIAQQKKELEPWMYEYSLMNINQAREMTGWTFSNQQELSRLLANQQAGLTWDNAEAQRANALAMQEAQFRHNMDMLEKQNEYALDLWS